MIKKSDVESIKNNEKEIMKYKLRNLNVDIDGLNMKKIYNEKDIFDTVINSIKEIDNIINIAIRQNKEYTLFSYLNRLDKKYIKKRNCFWNRKYEICESYKIIVKEITKRGFTSNVYKWSGDHFVDYYLSISIKDNKESNII